LADTVRRTFIFIAILLTTNFANAEQDAVWIGMSEPAHGEREGIYRATLDTETGALSQPVLAAAIGMPEFLALNPAGNRLYADCRLANGDGGVAAFEILEGGRRLRFLNSQPTGGGEACHVALDRSGHCLFSAQYGGGSVSAFPLASDGRIQRHTALVHQSGTGPDHDRQEGPHPHWVGTDPANRFLFVPDLGSDQVVIYEIDKAACTLKAHAAGHCSPGSGPRHFVFHTNGRFAYVVDELTDAVTAFRYDAAAGTLTEIQSVDSLPDKPRKVYCTGSEIYIHPTGRFLYAANRGDDSITAFAVNSDSGRLTYIETEPIRGSHPRCFNLDPSGKWLLAAGRDSNTISVFRIDPQTGRLHYNEQVVNSPAPICIEMQAAR
jgi:6-phosphogluconolactonase